MLIAILIVLLLLGACQKQQVNEVELKQAVEQKVEEITSLKESVAELEAKLKQAEAQIEKPTIIEKIVEKEAEIKTQKYPILAYSRKDEKGVVGFVEVSLLPGSGDTLIDVRPFNALAVQKSARNAVDAALNILGKGNLGNKDIKIKFNIDARAVGGESAGLAIGIATYSLLSGKKVKPHVAGTGTISTKGEIGKVGGILAKAEAISKKGVSIMLIPRGEAQITVKTPHHFVDPRTGKVVRKGKPVLRQINVLKEARQRWKMNVIQVSSLKEALDHALYEG